MYRRSNSAERKKEKMVEWHYCRLHIFHLVAILIIITSTSFGRAVFYLTGPTAIVPATWVNTPSLNLNSSFTLSPLLHRKVGGQEYALSFYCNTTDSTNCVLGILSFRFWGHNDNDSGIWFKDPRLIWAANRNKPVGVNATFQLRQDGNMVVSDSNGLQVWSSNTNGNSVSGLNMTDSGNLILSGKNNESIWQSFDYPTDSILIGQNIVPGKKLTASMSASDLSEGSYFLSFDAQSISAYVNSNPPQRFAYGDVQDRNLIDYYNGSYKSLQIPFSKAVGQYMNFGYDGHFRVYEWLDDKMIWHVAMDILQVIGGDCGYPLACGNYGICSKGKCSCPNTSEAASFFKPNNNATTLGCSLTNPISCGDITHHNLTELKDTYYFAFNSSLYDEKIELETCKTNCLNNCSCKAALFLHNNGSKTGGGSGGCMFLNEVFSIADNKFSQVSNANTSLFIRVQNTPQSPPQKNPSHKLAPYVGASVGGGVIMILICIILLTKKLMKSKDIESDFSDNLLGMPSKYSYEELKAATGNFCTKLGKGGFGSVYKGTLSNGIDIAVKCLHNVGKGQEDESFLAEVRSIGSVHHYNLVKVIGFCTDKSHRLLVYEYMINGSLDRWIFGKKKDFDDVNNDDDVISLQWHTRKKIIVDIAKGLAYLHEECSQKIIHLDIKPQNILLDKDFNAKVSDFGLAKLIEKDQSRTVTKMRGTPGYLAPEWLSSAITEKTDVYSFGVVTLEIICGRKNLDWSRTEEEKHLLSHYTEKAKEKDGLWELVDKTCEDIEKHRNEAEEMMKIAAWCLQTDFTKRPSMSLVVKVLEGLVPVETNLDLDLTNLSAFGIVARKYVKDDGSLTVVSPSLLSAPR